ncbi:MAG: ATP-binding protein [Candidatus Parcubacteria bacterium]|nr:ATP-binding protein [Candidatus Parcubacteria bacterium]
MTIFSLSGIFIVITSGIIILFILLKKQRTILQSLWALFLLSLFIWGLGVIFIGSSQNREFSLLLWRLSYVGVVFIPSLLFHFTNNFLTLNKDRIIKYNYILSLFYLALIFTSDLFIVDVKFLFNQFYYLNPATLLYKIFLVWFCSVLIYCVYKAIIIARKSSGLYRAQLKYFSIAVFLSIFGGLFDFLPVMDIYIYPYLNFLLPVSFSIIAYSILKYRFIDIRFVIKRSIIFTILVVIITGAYALFTYVVSALFQDIIGTQNLIVNAIITAIFVAVGFEPLKKLLSRVTDKFLFKAEYKPQEVLAEFSEQLTATLDLNLISKYIVAKTHEIFKTTVSSLFLYQKDSDEYEKISIAGKDVEGSVKKINKDLFAKVFGFLKKKNLEKNIIVREEIKKSNEQMNNKVLGLLIAELDRNDVSLVIPMFVKDELVGILFMGDKKSGDIYSSEDIKILGIIASQAAIAIKNSQLYEEQKLFAVHLKDEVDKATKELRTANIQLKKLDEAKSDFISIASHQLRTPLTAIIGYISMIKQGDFGKVPAYMEQPIDRVFLSTDRIIHLVEDLLNISRIESGRLEYEFKLTDLAAMVEDVFSELQIQAKKKDLQLIYIKPKKKIPKLSLDQSKVREVIMNLIDNAIKYTPKGKVTVSLEKTDDHVLFKVEDTGRGIAAEDMTLLFQKFSRVKGVQLVHTEGTGLGLYIAKNIIEKHNGKIWAESDGEGKGSRFMIEFKIGAKIPKVEMPSNTI